MLLTGHSLHLLDSFTPHPPRHFFTTRIPFEKEAASTEPNLRNADAMSTPAQAPAPTAARWSQRSTKGKRSELPSPAVGSPAAQAPKVTKKVRRLRWWASTVGWRRRENGARSLESKQDERIGRRKCANLLRDFCGSLSRRLFTRILRPRAETGPQSTSSGDCIGHQNLSACRLKISSFWGLAIPMSSDRRMAAFKPSTF